MTTISLFVAGAKGFNFLRRTIEESSIDVVCSYPSKGTLCNAYDEIKRLCQDHDVAFVDKHALAPSSYQASQFVFCVGWQFLIHEIDPRFIVFHDSLLPRYRGFAPTVAALIAGDDKLGVSAFRPVPGVDTGDILDQEPLRVTYPVTVREVYDKLGVAYAALAKRLLAAARTGPLVGSAQVEADATYSIWRSEEDYTIDWTQSAADIRRFIDALGWPYLGAKTRYQGNEIRIEHAQELPDLAFVNRQPGKIWAIGPTRLTAEIVCGQGILRIVRATLPDQTQLHFTSLRQRLGE
ncbi:methionyl-tRNA formyltransferase [Tardiphaga sp. 538_B7_N1_4]|uniref:methionyl-tRNA formyltransferase n=1 Tax=Tardiphaga sp. 538_B7_N1_4 TaxID=3240778 RepID=UPI003F2597D6